jgi:ATP-binding cassette subfamily B multidrug efflux pump
MPANSQNVRGPGRRGPVGAGSFKTMNKDVFGRLLKLLFRAYPGTLAVVVVCIVASAVIGVVPAVYIERIAGFIDEGLKTGWNAVAGRIASSILILVCLCAVGLAATTIYTQLMARVTQGFMHRLRTDMFAKMQSLPIKYFDQNSRGDIMSYYTNDVDALRQLISQSLPQLCAAALTTVCVLLVMIYFSIPLMLIVFLGIFFMTKATKSIGGKSAIYFVRQQKSLAAAEGYIEEMMNGQKVVKVFCHEKASEEAFDKLNGQLCQDAEYANRFGNIFMPVMMNIGNILYVLCAFVGGLIICSNGAVPNVSFQNLFTTGSMIAPLSIAVVASYLGMTKQFTGNVSQVSQQISAVAMAIAGADRIFTLLDQQPEQDEGTVTLVNCRMENGEAVECPEHTGHWAWKYPAKDALPSRLVPLAGDVRFFDVDFAYEEGKPVLHNISLYAKPGQKLAFVGATGAGKTTITNLINRFYDIADGKIRYDGVNINHIRKSDLRRSLGVVLQDVNLFTGTVMDNIRYGKLDATDDECIHAAKLANAHDFITRLPDGYNTMLTANGASLSQGQRQLISIARAAVADPPVMILDEATSSIDTRTEALVQKGMDALMQGRTVFVIAHRLSTVQNSNAILVLDHGRVIERGTHDDLIAQRGTYYRLYTGAFELE